MYSANEILLSDILVPGLNSENGEIALQFKTLNPLLSDSGFIKDRGFHIMVRTIR